MSPPSVDQRDCLVATYSYSTEQKFGEDIAAAEALLESRQGTRNILRTHYPLRHKASVDRLETEARNLRVRLEAARRAVSDEVRYRGALVDSGSGKRPRIEHEHDLLQTLDSQIGVFGRMAKRRRTADASRQKILAKQLEIVRDDLRDKRVVEIRKELFERHANFKRMEVDVSDLTALHASLCERIAALSAPVDLLSEATAYVDASKNQIELMHRVRDEFMESLNVKRSATKAAAVEKKTARERQSLGDHDPVARALHRLVEFLCSPWVLVRARNSVM